MQIIIWTGIVALGLITLSSAGIVFFYIVGQFRRQASPAVPQEPVMSRPQRRTGLRRVDLEKYRQEDREPMRRAA